MMMPPPLPYNAEQDIEEVLSAQSFLTSHHLITQRDVEIYKRIARTERTTTTTAVARWTRHLSSYTDEELEAFPANLVDSVKKTCARVTASAADLVQIDERALGELVERLRPKTHVEYDASGWHLTASEIDVRHAMQYVFVLSALNFCFWPATFEEHRSLEYEDMAVGLKAAIKRDPTAFEGERLARITEQEVKSWVNFPERTMGFRVAALRELGRALSEFGDAAAWVRESRHSAVRLVEFVANRLPHFRDESVFRGMPVRFYKRAQILVADVWAMCGRLRCEHADEAEAAFGSFYDIHHLTMFADYRVPQVLRHLGVLRYVNEGLVAVVDGGREETAKDSEAEVAIRAVCLTAVERIALALGRTAVETDWILWQWGESLIDRYNADRSSASPESNTKMLPPHRTLTWYY